MNAEARRIKYWRLQSFCEFFGEGALRTLWTGAFVLFPSALTTGTTIGCSGRLGSGDGCHSCGSDCSDRNGNRDGDGRPTAGTEWDRGLDLGFRRLGLVGAQQAIFERRPVKAPDNGLHFF